MRFVFYIFCAFITASSLSACGVKGKLKSPQRIEQDAAKKAAKEEKAKQEQQNEQQEQQQTSTENN